MKYSQWNDLLFEYYFLEDKGHQVFLAHIAGRRVLTA